MTLVDSDRAEQLSELLISLAMIDQEAGKYDPRSYFNEAMERGFRASLFELVDPDVFRRRYDDPVDIRDPPFCTSP